MNNLMNFEDSIILNTDSYKYTQYVQYPPGTEYIYSYIESRGGLYDRIVFFGLQAFLRKYLSKPITKKMVDCARDIVTAHGQPFNYAGWMYIVEEHNGRLPVQIKSVNEGTVIGTKNVLLSIVNTDPKCFWLTSFLETALLRAIWYPTTVATNSFVSKSIINEYLKKNGTPESIDFKLHDFGARGVSSLESAELGGMAHLVNFKGTDTMSGIIGAMKYYDAPVSGFSIPASEHSTITSWGRENEVDAYRNMLVQYAKKDAMLACVSDSYDIYKACEMWGTELKEEVINSGATLVIRPDSGDPVTVISKCLEILDKHYGHTVNDKGYKVLNHVRLIQGDGITYESIHNILSTMDENGYSADNIAFGQGGALLQMVNRDTSEFAMKCSAAYINGEWVDVFKDPVTSKMKKSKKGRFMLLLNENGDFVTERLDEQNADSDQLKLRFLNGVILNQSTFEQVRERAASHIV